MVGELGKGPEDMSVRAANMERLGMLPRPVRRLVGPVGPELRRGSSFGGQPVETEPNRHASSSLLTQPTRVSPFKLVGIIESPQQGAETEVSAATCRLGGRSFGTSKEIIGTVRINTAPALRAVCRDRSTIPAVSEYHG